MTRRKSRRASPRCCATARRFLLRPHEGIKLRFFSCAAADEAGGGTAPSSELFFLFADRALRRVRRLHGRIFEIRHEPRQSRRFQPAVSPEFPSTAKGISAT